MIVVTYYYIHSPYLASWVNHRNRGRDRHTENKQETKIMRRCDTGLDLISLSLSPTHTHTHTHTHTYTQIMLLDRIGRLGHAR